MHAITIKNLHKEYNGKAALNGISLDIQKGEFFGLLGPNGAGKTTTIGILTGLINKTAGNVTVLGYDLEKEYRIVKSKIGLVPQEFNFDPFFSLYDLLVYQAGFFGIRNKKAKQIAEQLLKQFDLWESRKKTMRQISGGMKRRLLITKALVHDPEILILDEPTAGVDIELRKKLWQMLQEMNKQGKTIILTTHYLEEAEELCKRIAIIHKGKIIEIDTKDSLMQRFSQDEIVITLTAAAKKNSERILKENGLKYTFENSNVRISVHSAEKQLPQILALIGNENIENVVIIQKTLEDIFLQLTHDN